MAEGGTTDTGDDFEEEREKIKTWQVIDDCRNNIGLQGDAVANKVDKETRQFACQPCDNVWWRNVPARKMVSRCKKCDRKYECLTREQEWGWAVFQCHCRNEFQSRSSFILYRIVKRHSRQSNVRRIWTCADNGYIAIAMVARQLKNTRWTQHYMRGFGAMHKTESRCYIERCQRPCRPARIVPPSRRQFNRRSRDRHSCTSPNCYNRARLRPGTQEPAVNICVHPKSLRQKVVEPSNPHGSTGSTVKTFLTQDNLITESEYVPSLADIDELP